MRRYLLWRANRTVDFGGGWRFQRARGLVMDNEKALGCLFFMVMVFLFVLAASGAFAR